MKRNASLGVGAIVFQPSTGLGTAAVADATTAHVSGAWVQAVASTADDVDLLCVQITSFVGAGATNTATLLDIGVGASGSEVVVVASVNIGYNIGAGGGSILLPVAIPLGSRVAYRVQSVVLSKSVPVRLLGLKNGDRAPSSLLALGANTATSQGTLPAGATVNTEGAWSTIVDPVPEPLAAIVVTLGGGGGTVYQTGNCLIDIGVGAAGSETVVVADVSASLTTSEVVTQPWSGPFLVDIPQGARLACRMQRDNASNALSVVVHGVRKIT